MLLLLFGGGKRNTESREQQHGRPYPGISFFFNGFNLIKWLKRQVIAPEETRQPALREDQPGAPRWDGCRTWGLPRGVVALSTPRRPTSPAPSAGKPCETLGARFPQGERGWVSPSLPRDEQPLRGTRGDADTQQGTHQGMP